MPTLDDWIALALLRGLSSLVKRRALERFRDPARVAFETGAADLRELTRARSNWSVVARSRRTLAREARQERRRCERDGVALTHLGAPDYPPGIAALPDAPIVLWRKGEPCPEPRVAIVGSRAASAYGLRTAERLAGGLAERGVTVVSGGARGIDAAAHRGALAASGPTVAVIGSGLARPYPRDHAELFSRMTLISELPLDFPVLPENFPRRNRLIVALADGVLIVEAEPRSGSSLTADHALTQGRDVMAVPGPIGSPTSLGCHRLIQQGARLICGVDDVLAELPGTPTLRPGSDDLGRREPAVDLAALPPDDRAIWQLLDCAEPVHGEQIAEKSGLSSARLHGALLRLQLRGAIDALPGGCYIRR